MYRCLLAFLSSQPVAEGCLPVLGSKTLNTSLGLGEIKIKYPVLDATWLGFHPPPPLGAFRRDTPALSRVRSS